LNFNSAPSLPFSNAGQFSAGNNFVFLSGSLSGSGTFTFTNVNFSGPALKVINTTADVTGTIFIDPGRGAQGVITIQQGKLVVTGTLRTTEILTINSLTGAQLSVPGSFLYEANSPTNMATIRGQASINVLHVTMGLVTISDSVNIASVTLDSGAVLTLIGDSTSTRMIGDITGAGTVQIQGGTNQFNTMSNIGSVSLSGGTLTASGKAVTIGNLLQTGGVFSGSASITVGVAHFSNAEILNSPISVSALTLEGFSTLDGSTLSVLQNGVISKLSQLTLENGAIFIVTKTAQISQSAAMSFLPSGTTNPSSFQNDGRWTSTSDLKIVVNTKGTGAYQFGTGSTSEITGIAFNAGSLTLTSSSFTSIGCVVSIGNIAGTGTIFSQGAQFVVSGELNAAKFTNANGDTQIGSGSIQLLDIQTGTFTVTGTGASAGTLTFEGGTIASPGPTSALLTVGTMKITGAQPKTLSVINVAATTLSLSCGTGQCQLFTQRANLTIPAAVSSKLRVIQK